MRERTDKSFPNSYTTAQGETKIYVSIEFNTFSVLPAKIFRLVTFTYSLESNKDS